MSLSDRAAVVRELRARRGWTQRELADNAGLSQAMISKIESGDTEMTGGTIRGLARVLGVSADVLVGLVPLPQDGDEEASLQTDPYPNRRLLRQSSDWTNAPPDVKVWVLGSHGDGHSADLTLSEWVEELRIAKGLHASGRLEAILHGPPPRRPTPHRK
jgi:transcriptional regulator with XRE-family HTH domain